MKTVKIDTVITIGMKEYAELKAKAEAMNAPDTVFLPRANFDRIAKKAAKYDTLKAAARRFVKLNDFPKTLQDNGWIEAYNKLAALLKETE